MERERERTAKICWYPCECYVIWAQKWMLFHISLCKMKNFHFFSALILVRRNNEGKITQKIYIHSYIYIYIDKGIQNMIRSEGTGVEGTRGKETEREKKDEQQYYYLIYRRKTTVMTKCFRFSMLTHMNWSNMVLLSKEMYDISSVYLIFCMIIFKRKYVERKKKLCHLCMPSSEHIVRIWNGWWNFLDKWKCLGRLKIKFFPFFCFVLI
jgi:hypothetical protein